MVNLRHGAPMTAPSQTPEAAGLEPCPFCGGEAWLNDYEAKYSDLPPKSRAPQCRSCGASLGYLTTPEKATEAWNRRVAAASAQAAIDAEKAKVAELSDAVRIISEKAENAINEGFRHITRATAAEARADRLAKALERIERSKSQTYGHLQSVARAALQQETQK